ncbi:hypothetical protein MM440_08775 [Arsenicicoccus piscis]|nr:hypothetical protein [Arsenicicoccus piscis]MCH8626214.1 hypothetical protein [Arsenicicoccus piscis]MCH8627876.1 hypothetical protein [Arsenicicoccus piscis]
MTSPDLGAEPTWRVDDGHRFAHAMCLECHWRGPGRRARETARQDGRLHALAGCGDDVALRELYSGLQDAGGAARPTAQPQIA